MSAVVLLILFVYTIYKSSSHIQGSSYYIGLFLFILLFFLLLKVNKDKVKAFFNKGKKKRNQLLILNLQKSSKSISNDDLNSNIQTVSSNYI